jgi:TonB family protein
MGKATAVVTEKTTNAENILTDEDGEAVNLDTRKPEVKENKMVITPVKPKEVVKEPVKELTTAEKLALKFQNKGGGIGNNEQAGQNGDETGDPFKNGNGGSGGGKDQGDGHAPGNGKGIGGSFGADLRGRTVLKQPKFPSDTKEEGKVVVEITVNAQGEVIEAIPNGRGTTTSSSALKAKAKKAAMETKFNVDGKYAEQKGTITIIFSFN